MTAVGNTPENAGPARHTFDPSALAGLSRRLRWVPKTRDAAVYCLGVLRDPSAGAAAREDAQDFLARLGLADLGGVA